MTSTNRLVVLLPLLLWASVILPRTALADDGAALYKAKCATCHGPEGQGKIGSALKGTRMSAEEIAALINDGDTARKAPHRKPLKSVSADEVKAIATFVKTLK